MDFVELTLKHIQNDKNMRIRTLLIICLFSCAMFCCSGVKHDVAQGSPEWLPLSVEAQEIILNDYVAALDEFAQVMPKFGSDTESQWAADTVHTMATSLRKNHFTFPQSYAIVCQMQNYTGYGMTYFNAIIGTHTNPELADFALRVTPYCDSIYYRLEDSKFEDVKTLSMFNVLSTENMRLFNTLNRINTNQQVDYELEFLFQSLGILDSIANLKEYPNKDIFKTSAILESYSFFQMVCPLLKLFSETKEKFDSHLDMIIDAANHFDSQSAPLFQSITDKRKMDIMSDAEFEEWMITTTQYKIKLLKLLTRFVEEWNQSEKNE